MKCKMAVILLLASFACGLAADHVAPLRRYRVAEESKVAVGMSPGQVKAKLGLPTAVDSGFPQIDGSQVILFDEPKMVGQLNNSTWFYFSAENVVRFTDDIMPDTKYAINGISTTKDLFEAYSAVDTLFILSGQIVDPVMGKGYRITRRSDLRTQPIDRDPKITYEMVPKVPRNKRIGEMKTVYLPVLCVIFDKGTGVVAATRAYYRYLNNNTTMFQPDTSADHR